MIFLFLMFTIYIAELFLVPLYVKKCWPHKNKTSLMIKMICSALFVLTAVFAMLYSGHKGVYTVVMLIGFGFSFVGDFFLHVNSKKSSFAIGFFSFFLAHISYITAYSLVMAKTYGKGFFSVWQLAIIVVIFVIAVIVAKTQKLQLGKIKIPVMVYAFVLTTMLVKACVLGSLIITNNVSVLGTVVLILGAVSFSISDSTLIFIYFSDKKSYGLKFINSATYFAAQLLLASSVLFIK